MEGVSAPDRFLVSPDVELARDVVARRWAPPGRRPARFRAPTGATWTPGGPGEGSCLTLVWAVLDLLITEQTNGILIRSPAPAFRPGSRAPRYRFRPGGESPWSGTPDARRGRARAAPKRPPLATAPPWRCRSLRAVDRRARRSSLVTHEPAGRHPGRLQVSARCECELRWDARLRGAATPWRLGRGGLLDGQLATGWAGVSPWRRIASPSATRSGGPPAAAVRTSAMSWK